MTIPLRFQAMVLPKTPPHKVVILHTLDESDQDFTSPIPLDRTLLMELKSLVETLSGLIE